MHFTRSVPALLLAAFLGIPAAQAATPGQFPVLVLFREGVDFGGFRASYKPDERAARNPAAWDYLDPGVAGMVQKLEKELGFRAEHVYSATLRGFAGRLTARQLGALEKHPAIASVTPEIEMFSMSQAPPLASPSLPKPEAPPGWAVDRIGGGKAVADAKGVVTNVSLFLFDTGAETAHPDLNVVRMVNFIDRIDGDCDGHGTYVAGAIGARGGKEGAPGVIPGVPLTAVKVLECDGSGGESAVIKGIDWVTATARRPAVAVLSFSGQATDRLDEALRRSAAAGVFYVAAAGGGGEDSCSMSPARAGAGKDNGILTVTATNEKAEETWWSNGGACIELWAPGMRVTTIKRGGGTLSSSGTSISAALAGGAAAVYLSEHPKATPADLEKALKTKAVPTGHKSREGREVREVRVTLRGAGASARR